MSRELMEKTTIAEWHDATEAFLAKEGNATKEENTEFGEYNKSLFGEIEPRMLSILIIQIVGVLKIKEMSRAISTMQVLEEELQKEYFLSQLPGGLRALLAALLKD